jgi:hypothetical protein
MPSRVSLMQYEAEFRKEIGATIRPLVTLLNDDDENIRWETVSALRKLADHGVFVALCYLDIANA